MSERETWPSRKRQGRGGGREFGFAGLPRAVRAAIEAAARRSDARVLDILAVPAAALAPVAPPRPAPQASTRPPLLTKAGQLRLDARAAVLSAFDTFRAARPVLRPKPARHLFVGHYNAGEIALEAACEAALPEISEPSLRRWLEARASGQAVALAGRYGNRSGTGMWDTGLVKLKAYFLGVAAQHPHLSVKQLRRTVAAAFGDHVEMVDADGLLTERPLPSLREFQRLLRRWQEEEPQVARSLRSPDGWRNNEMLALGDASAGIERPNQQWMIDASPQDVLLTEGRFQIYLLVDVFTRRVMVLVTKTPRTEAVKLLLRRALLDWGVPESLVTDNGSDFVSREARRVFAALGIGHDPSTPYSPWEKSFVERAIGTLQHGLFPMLPGYCGHSVAAAQDIRGRRTFAERLGETEREAFQVSLDAPAMQDRIDRWCRDEYEHEPHEGLGRQTPLQVLAAWRGELRRIEDQRALDMLLVRAAGERLVGKKGLRVNRGVYWDAGLHPWVGRGEALEVRIDPADAAVAYVYQIDPLAFVCVARRVDTLPARDRAAVATRAKAEQRRLLAAGRKAVKAGAPVLPLAALSEMVLADAARRNGTVVVLPKPSTPHETPGLSEGARAAAAMDTPVRPSVPAEEMERRRQVAAGQTAEIRPIRSEKAEKQARYARARGLEMAIAGGEAITDADRQWLGTYGGTAEYRSLRGMETDFGPRAVGLA